MASWNNGTKNSSSFTNDPFGEAGRTWGEATETWDENEGTWNNPFKPYAYQSKSASTFNNETKN